MIHESTSEAASTRAGGMDLLSPSRLSSQALRDASAALAAEDLRAAGGGAGRENPLGLREQDRAGFWYCNREFCWGLVNWNWRASAGCGDRYDGQ